jgi:ankyrin repeat protein
MTRVFKAVAVSFVAAAVFVTVARASGDGPLTKAVKAGDLQAVRTLLKSGADVNAKSGDGSTPLLWATHRSAADIARALIAAGAAVDTANDYGITPLLQATRTGDASLVEILLQAGASPAKAHPEGETPLMAAARSGSLASARLLLQRGADANAAEQFQKTTPLMWAAAEGHIEMVDLLIEAGADPNRQAHVTTLPDRHNSDYPTGGFTALMFAARSGNDALVRRLAQRGADLNLKNGDKASATMVAIYNDRFDVAATLLELGADANDGSLYVAVEMRDATTDQFAFDGSRRRPNHENRTTALDLIKILLEKGADPNKTFAGQFHSTHMPNTDRFDNTPFFRSSISADVEALKLMLAHGAKLEQLPEAPPPPPPGPPGALLPASNRRANPNAGRTPAMVAMTGGRGPGMTGGPAYIRDGAPPYREPGSRKAEEAFALLLGAGANPNAVGPDGTPLLHQVARAGNLENLRALAAAKVDFTQKNKDGLTALEVAEKPPAAGPGGRGGPAGGGARGRGGRGAGPREVAALLRELMGLPPAPPAPAAAPVEPAPAEPAAATAETTEAAQ